MGLSPGALEPEAKILIGGGVAVKGQDPDGVWELVRVGGGDGGRICLSLDSLLGAFW